MRKHFVTNSLSKRDKVITCIVALLLWATSILSVIAYIPNPPVAVFTMSASTVYVGQSVYFDASQSYDPDGYPLQYSWDFDDGSGTGGVTTSHSWSTPDTYTVWLTVTDTQWETGACSQYVLVLANPPPRRSDELTWNANFLTDYPDTWDLRHFIWNNVIGENWPMTSDNYAIWTDNGVVETRCRDTVWFDLTWNAINVDQGWDQLLPIESLDMSSLWYEAEVSNLGGDTSVGLLDWTGAKFDLVAREPDGVRDIHMEMYFWKTGVNAWGWDVENARHAGYSEWSYQVDLNQLPDYFIQTIDENGVMNFTINVLGLLERGIPLVNNVWPNAPNPPFTIENLRTDRVNFCLESGYNLWDPAGGPEVHATLHSLRARYDTADTKGDGICDILDVVFVASKYGSVIGDELWDFRADLNTDNKVDILDVVFCASHYGEAY